MFYFVLSDAGPVKHVIEHTIRTPKPYQLPPIQDQYQQPALPPPPQQPRIVAAPPPPPVQIMQQQPPQIIQAPAAPQIITANPVPQITNLNPPVPDNRPMFNKGGNYTLIISCCMILTGIMFSNCIAECSFIMYIGLPINLFLIIITFSITVLKFQTLYSIHFLPKFCFKCICFLKYLVEWQTV